MKVKKDKKAQKQLVYLLSIYLNSGFSMQSSFQLIQRGKQLSPQYLAQIEKMLCTGTELEEIFRTLHFSPQIIAQIQLAQIHGNLPLTLASIYQQLKLRQERLQKMRANLILSCIIIGIFVRNVIADAFYLITSVY
ncbi:type II secretion system F family protein [Enterococcus cecorum]